MSRTQDKYMQSHGENKLEGINDTMRNMEHAKRSTGCPKLGVLEKLSIRRPQNSLQVQIVNHYTSEQLKELNILASWLNYDLVRTVLFCVSKKSIIRRIIIWKCIGKWEVAANSYMHNSNCDSGLLTGSHPPGTKTLSPTVIKMAMQQYKLMNSQGKIISQL